MLHFLSNVKWLHLLFYLISSRCLNALQPNLQIFAFLLLLHWIQCYAALLTFSSMLKKNKNQTLHERKRKRQPISKHLVSLPGQSAKPLLNLPLLWACSFATNSALPWQPGRQPLTMNSHSGFQPYEDHRLPGGSERETRLYFKLIQVPSPFLFSIDLTFKA